MPTERRKTLRQNLAIPVRVQGFLADGTTWEEITTTVDVSSAGACFSVSHEAELGQVLLLSLALPKRMRQYDLVDAVYRVYALVRGVRRRADPARRGHVLRQVSAPQLPGAAGGPVPPPHGLARQRSRAPGPARGRDAVRGKPGRGAGRGRLRARSALARYARRRALGGRSAIRRGRPRRLVLGPRPAVRRGLPPPAQRSPAGRLGSRLHAPRPHRPVHDPEGPRRSRPPPCRARRHRSSSPRTRCPATAAAHRAWTSS